MIAELVILGAIAIFAFVFSGDDDGSGGPPDLHA
jgi:hypothetical protein